MNINIGFMRDFNLKVMLFSLGLKLNTKLGLHTHPPPTHQELYARLLGHFQACYEAEIWYVDLTHKYKMIQGEKSKLNPIPREGGT